MAYQFDFDATNKIARCRFEGNVSDDVFKNFYADAGKFVVLTEPRAALVDFSYVKLFDVSSRTLADIATQPPALPDVDRPRVMVAPDPFIFHMMRMFEIIGGRTRPNFRVVGALQEAWTLLGVLEPRFEPYGPLN